MTTFKNYLLEREDKANIELASRIATNMFEQLKTYYSNIFVVYFPKPKEVDNHENFMDWRDSCRRYEQNLPKYDDRTFSIQGPKGKLSAEYLDDRIYLYDRKFAYLYQDLREWHFQFEYNLRADYGNSNRRTNSTIKKNAKLLHEKMLQRMEENKEDFIDSLFHEIIHLLDHTRMGPKFNSVTKSGSARLTKEFSQKPKELKTQSEFDKIYNRIYMNSDIETNAYFLTNARRAFQSRFSSFDDLLKDFKSHFGTYWSVLSQSNQRRMIKRLYQIYSGST